jgi:hypothetical protein
MNGNPIYLDFSATTPAHPDALEAMLRFFGPAFRNRRVRIRMAFACDPQWSRYGLRWQR